MKEEFFTTVGLAIPFVGTCLGSSLAFLFKKNINKKIEVFIIGIASGVMIAASIWSLIIPSVEMAETLGIVGWIPASVGMLLGVFFLIYINKLAKKIENYSNGKKINMLLFSVTLHNIPEGMAVGVCFAGFLNHNVGLGLIEAMILSIGIAIQNIPEGAIISIPLKINDKKNGKAFIYGALSGIVEPISALITILITNLIVPIMPYLLPFAAGAMIYVVSKELIPQMHNSDNGSDLGTIGLTLGFLLMMILDITL